MEYDFKNYLFDAELNRTFVFLTANTYITGFKDFVYEANPTVYKENNLLKTVWLKIFRCLPPGYNESTRYLCNTNYSLRSVNDPGFNLENFHSTYNVYIAVYAIAHALHNMYISESKARRNDGLRMKQYRSREVPQSMCNEQCPPGFRKSSPDQITCCYSCVQCSASEISNQTDMENCLQCPSDEYPDAEQVICLPRTVHYLSYGDPIGVTLASFAIILIFITAVILGVFISHKNTPRVRANNRYLSYIILTSLMLSFSSSLLFIGSPSNISCLLQNVFFSIIFAIAVSSILAKTVTVLVAFSAVKPGSKFRIFLGFKVSMFIVILGSFGEVGICSWWLILWPPYPDKDSTTEATELTLYCNVGSYFLFYIALGYNWFLALICFVVAFLAKQLPDLFNEARYITFSMLVFCSVWVSFIPAYISTKGKNVVAVEIFAILASSTGIVGCIFFPKCFIIMLRPEFNSKQHLCITN
uniref:G-protein coupled receptors family 3 profile domain-containing protein n=1 Tax=Leptobrachium leishanense TaxID=445787 RepID=A0A8C5PLQ9_9ANUR